ncbi:MAG: RluA family pseudouridine synthase [Planctomycetota bacterium]
MELPFEYVVDDQTAGQRVDASLAARLPEFSRAHLRRAIDAGGVLINGTAPKPSQRLAAGDRVSVEPIDPPREGPEPEPIPLDLLYEDDWLVAVNKPAGMVVHPGKGHWSGTLTSALAHHFGESLSTTGGPTRPGIVHRLDRDTTGVIVVAKTNRAHERLAAQFKDRTTAKQYLAIVAGTPDRDADVIDEPIGPHPHSREKMAIRRDHRDAREAVTRYEVVEHFGATDGAGFAVVRCFPKTGRTHQIRVHLAHAGTPVLCDKLYGGRAAYGSLDRQALHAERLVIDHPATGERLTLEAPLPDDISRVIQLLSGRA